MHQVEKFDSIHGENKTRRIKFPRQEKSICKKDFKISKVDSSNQVADVCAKLLNKKKCYNVLERFHIVYAPDLLFFPPMEEDTRLL